MPLQLKDAKNIVLVGPMLSSTQALPVLPDVFYIFVDGGDKFIHLLPPKSSHLTVGDGDSATGKVDILFPTEKDFSDLKGALDYISRSKSHIHILGFLGGRKDHELINLGEIYNFMLNSSDLPPIQIGGDITLLPAGSSNLNFEGTFSLISFREQIISLEGDIDYPLTACTVDILSSQLLSNRAFGEFKIANDKPIFFYRLV